MHPRKDLKSRMWNWSHIPKLLLTVIVLILVSMDAFAQSDSTEKKVDTAQKKGIDSFLLKQKGIIGQLAENLLADTAQEDAKELERNDAPFQRYRGRVIRHIYIGALDFGVSIKDTSKRMNNGLTRLANNL